MPGRISMDLGEFSASDVVGPIRLVSRARDIKLEQFTQSVELETDRGDIEMTPGKLPLAAIDARSRLGQDRTAAAGEGGVPTGRDGGAGRRGERFRSAD